MPTLFHNPTAIFEERWVIEDANEQWYLFMSDEVFATLAPHSREMRVLILETLLRIESGDLS